MDGTIKKPSYMALNYGDSQLGEVSILKKMKSGGVAVALLAIIMVLTGGTLGIWFGLSSSATPSTTSTTIPTSTTMTTIKTTTTLTTSTTNPNTTTTPKLRLGT